MVSFNNISEFIYKKGNGHSTFEIRSDILQARLAWKQVTQYMLIIYHLVVLKDPLCFELC